MLTNGEYNATLPTLVSGQNEPLQLDSSGRLITTGGAGADFSAGATVVEERYSSSGVLTGDAAVKSGAGFVHTVTFSCADAAPTAGSFILYDNTAESGTQLLSVSFTTTWFAPVTVILNNTFANGLYAGFTTTADVNVSISYR